MSTKTPAAILREDNYICALIHKKCEKIPKSIDYHAADSV